MKNGSNGVKDANTKIWKKGMKKDTSNITSPGLKVRFNAKPEPKGAARGR